MPTPISICSAITKLGEFATRQQTDTQRSTVAQLTAQIAADDAAISNAQTQLDYATVKAPISGIVGFRQVDVGNIVNAATQTGIVTIAQIEPIAVIFTAPEEQLPDIKAAWRPPRPRRSRYSTDGKQLLSDRHARADQQPGRHHQRDYSAEGGVRQQGSCAVAGPVGLDAAPGQTLKDATVVPMTPSSTAPTASMPTRSTQDNKAELRKIKVTKSIDGRSVVDEGLSPGRAGDHGRTVQGSAGHAGEHRSRQLDAAPAKVKQE